MPWFSSWRGDQVAARDVKLLLLDVAGQTDHFHAVAQGGRHGVEDVGGADEQHFAQVEGLVDVVVLESVVLLRVQDLEQGRGGIAAEVRAELVHLVEHEHRVLALRAAQALDHLAGEGSDVGAAMSADLRLVAHAPQGDAMELPSHGRGDGPSERGLAHAGRPHEAEDGPLDVGLHLAHGQVLEDPLLDLLEVVVIVVQDFLGPLDVDLGLRPLVPGQGHEPVQVGAGHGCTRPPPATSWRGGPSRGGPPS